MVAKCYSTLFYDTFLATNKLSRELRDSKTVRQRVTLLELFAKSVVRYSKENREKKRRRRFDRLSEKGTAHSLTDKQRQAIKQISGAQ